MRYGHVNNGIIDQGPRGLPKAWENISGLDNMTIEQLRVLGWLPWELITVPVGVNQLLAGSTVVVETTRITETQVVRDMTPAEIDARDQQQRDQNKAQAMIMLQATDWTTIPDVGNSTVSTPYLVNVQEFIDYRNQVRAIAVNPPVTVSEWPEVPAEQWG